MKASENINRKTYDKALVVGLGKTGLSCARFLAQRGFQVAVTDSRESPPGLTELREAVPNIAVFLGGFDSQVFSASEIIILSPGVSPSEPLVLDAAARGVPIIGDIEVFAQFSNAPVIGITGSNGKSTVTTLVAELLQAAGRKVGVGGNLGTPALELLRGDYDVYVLELSSFQLETTYSLECAASVVLNLSPDHIDRHKTLSAYEQAKMRIYRGEGSVVVNSDEPLIEGAALSGRHLVKYSVSKTLGDVDVGLTKHQGEEWIVAGGELILPVTKLKLKGQHNISNVLAALSLLVAFNVPLEGLQEVLTRFSGLAHRMQLVEENAHLTWINDSKATNVGATMAALQGLPGKIILIAGGQAKGGDFSVLKDAVKNKTRAVILLGEDAGLIEEAIDGVVPVVRVNTMSDAVHEAARLAQTGDTVLLSPACASFDLYQDYAARGNAYIKAVRTLSSAKVGAS